MAAIVFSAVLYFVVFVIAVAMVRPINAQRLTFAVLYLMLLIVLGSINYEFDLIEQKFASTFSYERFLGVQTFYNGNFLFQAWVNSPGFALTRSWEAAIGINMAIFAAMFLMVDRIRWVYVAIFLSPAVVHISLFALRDVVMTATVFLFCLTVLPHKRPNLGLLAFFAVAFFMQRPELLAVFGLAYGLFYFREFSVVQKVFVGSAVFAIVVFLLPQAPRVLGLPPASSIFAVPDILLQFAQLRADRWTGTDGGDTAILGGALSSIPLLLRFPLQVFVFFISPFPTDFSGPTSLIFLIDSLVFCIVAYAFFKVADRRHKYVFIVYILANAFFMANYGNMFRVRMPCYFIMLSGFLVYYQGRETVQARGILARLRPAY